MEFTQKETTKDKTENPEEIIDIMDAIQVEEEPTCSKCDDMQSRYFEMVCQEESKTNLGVMQEKWNKHLKSHIKSKQCTLCHNHSLSSIFECNLHAAAHMCHVYESYISSLSSDGGAFNRTNDLVDDVLRRAISLIETKGEGLVPTQKRKRCMEKTSLFSCKLCIRRGPHIVGDHHTFPYQVVDGHCYKTIVDHLVENHYDTNCCQLCGISISKDGIYLHMADHVKRFQNRQEDYFLQPASSEVTKKFHESLQKAESNKKQKTYAKVSDSADDTNVDIITIDSLQSDDDADVDIFN